MPLNSPKKPSIIVVWLQALMWNIFISYIHTQNGLAKSLIKRLIDRPLSNNCKSPTLCWHHAVLQTVNLIQIHLTAIITEPLIVVITWNLAPAKYFPSACRLCFHTYRYHHQSIHPWALRIHTRYLSVIHKISWITLRD